MRHNSLGCRAKTSTYKVSEGHRPLGESCLAQARNRADMKWLSAGDTEVMLAVQLLVVNGNDQVQPAGKAVCAAKDERRCSP